MMGNNRCKRCGKGSHSTQAHDAAFSRPDSSAVPPDFKSFSQCSNVIELTAWLKENALPPYRQFALALACKLESFAPSATAEVTAEHEALEYVLLRWNAFYPNLLGGEYKGLGMLRHAMRVAEQVLTSAKGEKA